MRASTFFASAAALVSAVSAGTIPTLAKRYNVTEAWGSWQVTNITASNHPSNDAISFQVWWNDGYSGPALCSYSGYTIGSNDTWHQCGGDATYADTVSFNLNTEWNQLSLSQDLYQRSAIVHLNGSAPLNIQWGFSSSGSEGTAENFYVPRTSVYYTLPNGTVTEPEFSTRK